MIPKILHYVWLGPAPIPVKQQGIIDEWKRIMPDYQLICWGNDIAKQLNIAFIDEACSIGKWAFASDVVRLWVLYHYGGIYLDTDVLVKTTFDPLLKNRVFIGREDCLQIRGKKTEFDLTSFCLGAEKGSPFIGRCLDYYNGRHFILSTNESIPADLRLDMRNASEIYSRMAIPFGYNPSALATETQSLADLEIIPAGVLKQFCSHLSTGSWREVPIADENYTLKYKISWRIVRIVSSILRRFNYILFKLR